ncbi:response regulator transcription factor [Sphingomonas sp. VNH70]|uniref:response regulator transcription factor n=1 Tax=Sphingomonas silueang TaxID=3156617 RepID=UPI0032B4ABA7
MRVALLEDEYEWAQLVDRATAAVGWTTTWFRSRDEFATSFRVAAFDVLVTDIHLADQTVKGSDIVRGLRDAGVAIPVLMLTQFAAAHPPAAMLDTGADDYLAKPFDPDELIARLRALARRARDSDPALLRIGPLRVSRHHHSAHWLGERIPLRGQSFDILVCLALDAGQVVSPAMLWQTVWSRFPNLPPQESPIQAAVSRLRRDIEAVTSAPLIRTVPGRGYLLDVRGATGG